MSQLQEGQPETSVAQLPQIHSKVTVLIKSCYTSFLGRRGGGRWHTKGSKQATKEETGGRELRTTDEILRLRKKASQNKYRQMSKNERAKRRQQRKVPSHRSTTRTSKRRKR